MLSGVFDDREKDWQEGLSLRPAGQNAASNVGPSDMHGDPSQNSAQRASLPPLPEPKLSGMPGTEAMKRIFGINDTVCCIPTDVRQIERTL